MLRILRFIFRGFCSVFMLGLLYSLLVFFCIPLPAPLLTKPQQTIGLFSQSKVDTSLDIGFATRFLMPIPESWLAKIGMGVFLPGFDPRMSSKDKEDLLKCVASSYLRIEQAAPELKSIMGASAYDLLSGRYQLGQYYLITPKQLKGAKPGLIVFMHGSFGNLQVYLDLWLPIAEKLGVYVALPSNGFGNWDRPLVASQIESLTSELNTTLALDPAKTVLAGLSSGGVGVLNSLSLKPQKTIFISAVMPERLLRSYNQEIPALIISGDADHNVPREEGLEAQALLRKKATNVRFEVIPGDHFLFLRQRSKIAEIIVSWLE